MIFLKQSTASQEVLLGPFVDSTDGVTAETGLTIANTDIKIHKAGATTLADKNSGGATHISGGRYYAVLDATDTDTLGSGQIHVSVTGALPVKLDFCVLPANIYDSFIGNTDLLDVSLVQVAGSTTNVSALATNVDAILTDTAVIGAAGAGLTAVPWNAAWDAEVQSEVDDALVARGLDHLVNAAVAGTDVADDSIVAKLVSSAATADWDTYVNTTDALQAIRDRGDAAWTTGGGGSITDIIQWEPLVPLAIDLANTKTYRLGIALTNMVDDLPTTTEITPGTISIDRAAQGGTTWTAVRTDVACSEIDGLIYYDETFNTANGYASGDVLRITFKNQVVTVSANDYALTGSTGRIFYTGIIADTPNVNVTQISGSSTAADVLELFALALDTGTGQIDNGTFAANAIQAAAIQDGAFTSAKFADAFLTAAKLATNAITAAKIAADAVAELQSGLATAAALATVDGIVDDILVDTGTTIPALLGTPAGVSLSADVAAVKTQTDAIETDTQNIQSRIPAALNNGVMPADIQRINNVEITGDGSVTPFTV